MAKHIPGTVVKVIETIGGHIASVKGFPNTAAGRKRAEGLFVKLCKENTDTFAKLSKDEAARVVEAGEYDDGSTAASNSHPWAASIIEPRKKADRARVVLAGLKAWADGVRKQPVTKTPKA